MVVTVVKIIWAIAAVGVCVLVLLHSPKGDGLGALGGQAQLFTSTKSAEETLNRATWATADCVYDADGGFERRLAECPCRLGPCLGPFTDG